MTLLSVGNLGKYYGAEQIFQDLSFQVARGDKAALVGVNGAGKSTLLKIIAGLEAPDSGQVAAARGLRVAYLAQEVRFQGDRTLWEEMEAALSNLADLQAQMLALEPVIAATDAPGWAEAMDAYGELSARFEHGGGYEIEPRIKRTLQGLGFHEAQHHQRLSQFSGGQKTRAALAATLLSDPDLLLLDEPTNHLDMQALEWLEQFLRNWDGTLI
ncbi:MAG: ABC-F family ATP-binding cassette domain-containing protein, partial [Chloroflexia bacterium]|nr:ABC-F family ATP-binding cassette domain-containing protein [Chloroflexia bacterium]